MRSIQTAHIISHTHWDREWYLNSPYTNAWLPAFFDALFQMLEKEPGYRFVLDGQTALIEDWLAQLALTGKDPEPAYNRLAKAVREGRVCAGPYYLQPDWQLVSEEALVRNLMIGRAEAARLGGCMPVGWLLDNFGQISQAPQIHRQFGIDGLFVWRGVEMGPAQIQSEFRWDAPDGSCVLAVYLVGSYRNGMRLAEYPRAMRGRIRGEVEKLAQFATTPNVLLMNGYDQEMRPDDILPHLKTGLEIDGTRVVQSTPGEYLDAVRHSHPRLSQLTGALYSGRYIAVFPGVLSSRMYLKQRNHACQQEIEKLVEPLSTLLWGLGQAYPAEQLARAWKVLLKNHPHDSICGVSIDDVHTDMERRFAEVQAAVGGLARKALAALSAGIDTDQPPGALRRWLVFNPGVKAWSGIVTLQDELPDGTALYDSFGARLRCQRGAGGKFIVDPGGIPGLGYTVLSALPMPETASEPAAAPMLKIDPEAGSIENELIRLVIHADGSLALTDRLSGAIYNSLGFFEDGGDAGDTYTYSYPEEDRVITSLEKTAHIHWIETGPLRARVKISVALALPEELSADRKTRGDACRELLVDTTLTVEAHSAVVQFETEIFNNVRDHRLRVLFPSGIAAQDSFCETAFDVVKHPIQPVQYDDSTIPAQVRRVIIGAREPTPVTAFSQRTFVDISDGLRGLAVLNQGLPEVEVLPGQNTIALTLFRSVNWIARPDLLTRIGDAGPMIAVPGAQCLRRMVFHYAMYPHPGDWQSGQVLAQAERYNRPLAACRVEGHGGALEGSQGFLTLHEERNLLKVTAVKRSEDGQAVIVRLFNPSDTALTGRLGLSFLVQNASYASLDELPLDTIPVRDGRNVPISVLPKKIVTLRLEIDRLALQLPERGASATWIDVQEQGSASDMAADLAGSIRVMDIESEKNRAVELENALAGPQRKLAAFLRQAVTDPVWHELERTRLQLEVETCQRAALEARLSAVLLQKNGRSADPSRPQEKVEGILRRIGDELNEARIRKRATEYLLDYYQQEASNQR